MQTRARSVPRSRVSNRFSPGGLDTLQRSAITVQTGEQLFNERFIGRSRYADEVALFCTSVPTASTYQFRMSSLFDPDLTSTGHQPFFRDTLASIYSYYKVFRVDYEVTFLKPSTTGLWVGLNLYSSLGSSQSVAGLTLGNIRERTETSMKMLSTGGSESQVFKGSVDLAKVHGLSDAEYRFDGTNYSGAIGGNPSQNALFELVLVDPYSGATSGCAISFIYRFHFEMWGLTVPAQS